MTKTFAPIEFIAAQFNENTGTECTENTGTLATETLQVETKVEAKARAPKPTDKIVADMNAIALSMAKPNSKTPIDIGDVHDVIAALEAAMEFIGFIENSGASILAGKWARLALAGKVSYTELRDGIKHMNEVVLPLATETQELREVDALEAAAE